MEMSNKKYKHGWMKAWTSMHEKKYFFEFSTLLIC